MHVCLHIAVTVTQDGSSLQNVERGSCEIARATFDGYVDVEEFFEVQSGYILRDSTRHCELWHQFFECRDCSFEFMSFYSDQLNGLSKYHKKWIQIFHKTKCSCGSDALLHLFEPP